MIFKISLLIAGGFVLHSAVAFCGTDDDGVLRTGTAFERDRSVKPAKLPDSTEQEKPQNSAGAPSLEDKNLSTESAQPRSTPQPKNFLGPRKLTPSGAGQANPVIPQNQSGTPGNPYSEP